MRGDMYLYKLTLKNFMCFKECTINLEQDITFFVGNNGSGKTAIFQALGKLFGKTKEERTILKSDFYINNDESFNNMPSKEMVIEAEFLFPELNNSSELRDNLAIFSQYIFFSKQDNKYKAILRLESSWDDSQYEYDVDSKKYWLINDTEHIVFGDEDAYKILANNTILRYIDYIYIPAYRNSQAICRDIIKKIGNLISKYAEYDDAVEKLTEINVNLNEKIQELNGIKEILNIINQMWEQVIDRDIRYCSNLVFNVSSNSIENLLQNIMLYIDLDYGNKFELEKLSDGQLSLLYIVLSLSMFELEHKLEEGLLKGFRDINEKIITYTIFILEEPENHLSPFYLSKIFNLLYDIINRYKNVIGLVSTHSAAVIKRVHRLEQIRYFRHKIIKEHRYTIIKPLTLPSKKTKEDYKYIVQAVLAHPEIYFSKLVILGEGASEEIVIPSISKKLGFELDPSFIAFVKLNGRHVNHMWRLLKDLDIPYLTLLDFDLGRSTGGIGSLKYIQNMLIDYNKQFTLVLPDGISNINDIKKEDDFNSVLKTLEQYNIFYSYPLDLDFLMLSHYQKEYRIDEIDNDEFIKEVFKSHNNYKEYEDIYKDKENILRKYKKLFINNSKVAAHYNGIAEIMALSNEECANKCPQVIKRLVQKANKLINGENNEKR